MATINNNIKVVEILIRYYYKAQRDAAFVYFQTMYLGVLEHIKLREEFFTNLKETDTELFNLLSFLDLRRYLFNGESLEVLSQLAAVGVDPLQLDDAKWDAFDWAYSCDTREKLAEAFPEHSKEVDYDARRQTWAQRFPQIVGWDVGTFTSDKSINLTEDKSFTALRFEEALNGDKLPVPSHPYQKFI
ncbi:hypothetical protein AA313_de0203251 [Arthrobotrys entomopaga]|nr:hypothetical protein AA313_de0203251 [Arthrobotrys entomopaga]